MCDVRGNARTGSQRRAACLVRLRKRSCTRNGASLLLTLVVVAGILVLFAILARLVMVERRVSRGYSEVQRAEMAAMAGVADAGSLLTQLFRDFPDSATYWDPAIAGTPTPGTVFMFRDLTPDKEYQGASTPAPVVYARPLVSGSTTREFYPDNQFSQTLPADAFTGTNRSINLNEPGRFGGGDENGWIGAMPGATPEPVRAPWVEILQNPDSPADPESNRAIARYAWWIEDESFKLNVNTARAAPRGQPANELVLINGREEGNPRPTFQGLVADSAEPEFVADRMEAAREALAVTGYRFLSPAQVGHSAMAPDDTTPENFHRDYKYLLTTESSGLNLSRTGAKRLNINRVVDKGLEGIPNDPTGRPDLRDPSAPTQIRAAVERIMEAIKAQAPRFGQRFFRLQKTSILVPTTSAEVAADKNALDVPNSAAQPFEDLYIRKIAVNIHDYISPAVNPTIMDWDGNLLIGRPFHAGDIFNSSLGPISSGANITERNPFGAAGKKRVPYFTEYMVNAKMLKRVPTLGKKPGANSLIGYADYELEIDHYFEFWNMSDSDIRPVDGDLGPDPWLVLENQPAMSVNNHTSKPGQDVPMGRSFEIRLDEKFMLNGSDVDLVFPAGSVTVITTDPDYLLRTAGTGLAGKTVYVAKALYEVGTENRCDLASFSEPPYPPDSEGTVNLPMPNVRRYKVTSFDSREGDHEIQFGPDMEGSTTMKLIIGNRYGILEAHPSLAMGAQGKNMIVFKHGRPGMYRGSLASGNEAGFQAGYYDPRGSMEAIDIRLDNSSVALPAAVLPTSMALLNKQTATATDPGASHLGAIASTNFSAATSASDGKQPLWNTDHVTNLQGAVHAPMVIANAPMKGIGELGHVFDPVRHGSDNLDELSRRRAGGRTLTIGQPDPAWDGTRDDSQTSAELACQVSPSRAWTAWRLADIFTVRRDEEMTGIEPGPGNHTEVAGLYNPNGILRDGGRVLRTLVEGLRHPPGSGSDPALAGSAFNTANTDIIPGGLSANQKQDGIQAGGQALATYLAQRLTRGFDSRFSPLWEPGELSQLFLFSTANDTPQLANGVGLSAVNDRGREEVTRRLMDLVTPKGNIYVVYVVGQSLDRKGNVTAVKARRITMRLRPVFGAALNDAFNPADAAAVTERFRPPDSYALQILSVEDA